MTNPIVTLVVTQNVAPSPLTLQQTGALISQGATTTAVNTKTLLTQSSDLTPILKGALAISTLVWSASVVTAVTAAPHGFTISDTLPITITGATPAGYNVTGVTATITGASTFTYPLASNPGANTVPGFYTPEDVAELLAMVTTFFNQGTNASVFVFELGAGNAADGVTALSTYLTTNPNAFYSYCVPRFWAAETTFLSFINGFNATTSKTYFYVTMTNANYTNYTAVMKCVKGWIEAPGIPATEFSIAAWMQNELARKPSSTSKVPPAAFTYLFGVTAFPTVGNNTLLTTYKAAHVNVAGTGAEGGISNTILFWGQGMDGNDSTYWYSIDWMQLNGDQAAANAVIQGSNTPSNPLYYNQDGINRLQSVLVSTVNQAVSAGLVLGTVTQVTLTPADLASAIAAGTFIGLAVVNAIPFIPYSQANPLDYPAGKYSGLSIIFVPSRGFTAIALNINVSNFVAQ